MENKQSLQFNSYTNGTKLLLKLISITMIAVILLCSETTMNVANAASSSDNTQGYIDADSLNLRAKPNKKSKIIDEYERGQTVLIIGKDGDWYKVEVDGNTGYMLKKYISVGDGATRSNKTTRTEKPEKTHKPTKTEKPEKTTRSSSGMVWIPAKGGKKYHSNSSCSNMNQPQEVTLDEAESRGFTACKKCY